MLFIKLCFGKITRGSLFSKFKCYCPEMNSDKLSLSLNKKSKQYQSWLGRIGLLAFSKSLNLYRLSKHCLFANSFGKILLNLRSRWKYLHCFETRVSQMLGDIFHPGQYS